MSRATLEEGEVMVLWEEDRAASTFELKEVVDLTEGGGLPVDGGM